MVDSDVNKTLIYLEEVETVAHEVLSKKHLKLDLSNARNKFNEAYRALQKSDCNQTFLKVGPSYLQFPKSIALSVLKDDIEKTDEEIESLRKEIQDKVCQLRDLEHEPRIVGIGLKPLSNIEAKAIHKVLGYE